MQQERRHQREDFHLQYKSSSSTEFLAMVSALTHVVSKPLLRPSPSIAVVMDSSATTSYSSNSTSGSWTARGSQEQQEMDLQSLNITIQDRIKSAMRHIEIFYQFWAPVTVAGQTFLITSDQPFWCDYFDEKIHYYREISSTHMYNIGIGRKQDQLGPPGRVFLQGSPEFTPNVKYYSNKEYRLRNYALCCGVKKYCALPLFESTKESRLCIGVLELLPTSPEDEIRTVSMLALEALQTVGLVSSGNYFRRCRDIYTNQCTGAVRAESKKLLAVLCKKFSLPIARAWVPCPPEAQLIAGECHYSWIKNDVTRLFVDETDGIRDDSEEICSFRVNSSSLQEWQGLVGKAFASQKSCFCKDITKFSMMDYPFVHYALECELTSCFAICLHGIDPRLCIYILELFLEPGGMYTGDPQALLQSILATMAPHLHYFKVAERQEEEGNNLIHEVHLFASYDNVDYFQISQGTLKESEASENKRDESELFLVCMRDQSELNSSKEIEGKNGSKIEGVEREVSDTNSKKEGRIELEGKGEDAGDGITYELVKQHFGRKLVDAARSFQVSRSTLKRKCRKLGISRWPSHRTTNLLSVEEELVGNCGTGPPKSNVVPEGDTSAAETAKKDKNTIIFKATHGDHIIKFPLSVSSGIENLKREIQKRLKLESCIIKYKDEDDDWILIACDDDLHQCMQQSQELLGKNSVQLLVMDNKAANKLFELGTC